MRVVDAAGHVLRPEADISDLTASLRVGSATWDGNTLVLPFDVEPTPAEQVLIRRRLMTRDAEHEAWVSAVAEVTAELAPDTPTRRLLLLLSDAAMRGIDAP